MIYEHQYIAAQVVVLREKRRVEIEEKKKLDKQKENEIWQKARNAVTSL